MTNLQHSNKSTVLMNFILFSDIGESTINKGLGAAEYSYYFVLKAFRDALIELGTITIVKHPETEVDPLFLECQQQGIECVFLSFAPPNKTLVDLKCPTISVFAWEYSNIPNELWDENLRNDWRYVFACHGRSIALSHYTVRAVKEAMGQDFPALAVPTPLWEHFADARLRLGRNLPTKASTFSLRGTILDSRVLNLSVESLNAASEVATGSVEEAPAPIEEVLPQPIPLPTKNWRYRLGATKRHFLAWYREVMRDVLPNWFARMIATSGRVSVALLKAIWHIVKSSITKERRPEPALPKSPPVIVQEPEVTVDLNGVVYTSVFSPKDGRKNWFDMVTAFCWTFRDVEDATLVLKMNSRDLLSYEATLMTLLSRLSPFKCRVVTLHAFLDDATYENLIGATTFYVNTSLCEGLCLPLLEFMSCGKPVIAPNHTAMEDYVDESVAFVIKSGLEQNVWPHDPRDLFRTLRYRLEWPSICAAYRESYQMARHAPEKYEQMSGRVLAKMQSYASVAVVKQQLQDFFQQTGNSERTDA
jgi:glycosyltransferase involved in cell wall biosynthesis